MDKNFCSWQKTLSLTETLFLGPKCVSLTETQTETCFCNGNLFSKEKLFAERHFCLKKTCFCNLKYFSSKEVCFCNGKLLCNNNLFLSQKLVLSKICFLGDVICDFQVKDSMRNGSFWYLGKPR